MSDQNRYASQGGLPMPSDSSLNSGSQNPPSPMVSESPSSEESHPQKNSTEQCVAEARPASVQPMSKMGAQGVSSSPVHAVSRLDVNTGQTDVEHRLNTQDEHPLNRQYAHGLNAHSEQKLNSLSEQGVNSQVEQSDNSAEEPSEPVFLLRQKVASWTTNQVKVLRMFMKCGHCVTNYKGIAETLGIPFGTVRNIVRRLKNADLIRYEHYKNATIQGIEVWYCGPKSYFPGPNSDDIAQGSLVVKEHAACTSTGHSQWTGGEHPVWTETEHPAYMEDRKKEEEKNHSILTLSKNQIDELWPSIGKAGLFASHLKEVLSAMKIQGIEEKPEKIIAQSLRFIDWQLSQGPLKDKHGNEVLDPVAYWRAAMKSNGFYQKPPGYVDPEVLALQQLTEEEVAKLKAKRSVALQREENDKAARREELDAILRALAEQGERHSLWSEVHSSWTDSVRQEVKKNPQALVSSPGIAATTRIFLRKYYGWPE